MSRQTYVDSLNSKSLATRNKKNTNDDKRYFGDYVIFYKNPESSLFASISHSYDIEIIGFGDKNSIEQKTSIKILNSEKSNSYSQEISVNVDFSDYKYVFFSCPIHDTIYKARLVQWPAPENNIPRLKIANNSTDISKYINNEKKEVCFSGNIVFDNHVYTPKGYTVIFDAGTIIDITNKSAFIINSNIIINGTEENPVNIYSSDKTANGFTILQSDKKSIVNHTQFDNLSNLDYNGWTLTGAVTFYEADVEFNNCTFTNNHCEDMLNTIRCNFVLNDCTLKNTFGDSHDSDYCTGTLNNCTFTNNGNDAIDFSTSNATITNCTINGAIDKGISVGENTKATIIDVIISDVNIGIASKDLSHAEIDGCTINNATYGFLLLQKKPEFGSATITAKNCKLNNVWTNSLIEKHSTLILNGKEYKGNKTKLKPLFYE